jgi:hypothetical protein
MEARPWGDAPDLPVVIKGASRDDLPELFRRRGYRTGAEIGVYHGDYSEQLCRGIPGLQLTCVDSWVTRQGQNPHFKGGQPFPPDLPEAYAHTRERLAPYAVTYLRMWSADAARYVPNASLDFVYLDATHWFENVVADLALWVPKVRVGGIVAGHDYEDRFYADNRVSVAVQGWTKSYGISPWFVLGRHRVRPGEVRDKERSFLWVTT